MPAETIIQTRGLDVAIVCFIQAKNLLNVWWIRNEKIIEESLKHQIEQWEKSKSTHRSILRIQKLVENDYGLYKCEAIGEYGRSSKTIKLSGKY